MNWFVRPHTTHKVPMNNPVLDSIVPMMAYTKAHTERMTLPLKWAQRAYRKHTNAWPRIGPTMRATRVP